MERAGEVVTARVTTVSPLLRRGLLRAAAGAGFTIVPAHRPADVTLRADARSREQPEGEVEGGVDIVVEAGLVIVTVRAAPDLLTLLKVHGLLEALLNARTPANG